MTLLALLIGCAKPAPPTPPTTPAAGLVEVHGQAARVPEREAVLRVLAGATPTACYEAALARNPGAHGEVVVRFRIAATGQVEEAVPTFSTLADAEAERCVAAVVGTLRFPAPSRPGLTVVYPFLFTSDATPPEVARALKVRYGLVPEEIPGEPSDPRTEVPPGVIITW